MAINKSRIKKLEHAYKFRSEAARQPTIEEIHAVLDAAQQMIEGYIFCDTHEGDCETCDSGPVCPLYTVYVEKMDDRPALAQFVRALVTNTANIRNKQQELIITDDYPD